jgi:hypothetical protein
MAPTALTSWPNTITAGTTVKLLRSFNDFPANQSWALSVYLAGPSVLGPIAATASGANFSITLTAAQTATLLPGTYVVREIATLTGDSYVAEENTVTVEPNIATAVAGDMQLQAEKQLTVVQAAIAGRLTADMQAYQIGNRLITKIPIMELYQIEANLISRIRAARSKGSFGSSVLVQFDQSTQ